MRSGLAEGSVPESLASYAQRTQTIYNASAVYLARPDGTVVVAADPTPGATGSTSGTAPSSSAGVEW